MNIKVRVKVFAGLRDIVPTELDVELAQGTTLSRLMEMLYGRYPGLAAEICDASGSLKPLVNVLQNGRNVFFLEDLKTKLMDGDEIAIFPPVAIGG